MLPILIGALTLGSVTPSEVEEPRGWTSLDDELDALSSALQGGESAFDWTAYLRVIVAQDSDSPAFAGQPNPDVFGTALDRARLGAQATSGDYTFEVLFEAAGGDLRALDAFARWECRPDLHTTVGRFQPPLYWNALVDPRDQLFILRTASDEFWIGGRPTQFADHVGVMVDGSFDRLHWWLAAQNGVDGTLDELAVTGRLRYDVLGPGVGMTEGAYHAPEDATLSVGAGWYDDGGAVDGGGNSANGDCLAVDAQYANGRWAMNAELLDYASGSVNVFDAPGSTPWAVTLSCMLDPEHWEVAARYQDVDTPTNLADVTVGVNYYVAGHPVKWQLNVINTTSDNSVEETTSIALALTVGK